LILSFAAFHLAVLDLIGRNLNFVLAKDIEIFYIMKPNPGQWLKGVNLFGVIFCLNFRIRYLLYDEGSSIRQQANSIGEQPVRQHHPPARIITLSLVPSARDSPGS